MKKISVELSDGKRAEGYAKRTSKGTWIHLDGETRFVESDLRSARRGKKGAAATNPGEIIAPMPGKIIKIMSKPGEKVRTGQVLLVMEAMKMEYTLKAAADGEVASVACAVGDQVALGQRLAKLEI